MLTFLRPLTLLLLLTPPAAFSGDAELEEVVTKMEQDVFELARTLEELYATRCTTSLDDCFRSNYDNCLSLLPSPTCPASEEFIIEACNECGALFDFSTSTVSLPKEVADGENGNPTDVQAIESICYSRHLDQWFRDKQTADESYWASFDSDSPQMFFGAQDGSFRIFPGRRYSTCGVYDPRQRPWYIAASSGPKNIVLVLDTSGSMYGQRIALLKEAAKRIVSTLTVADRVAIVPFDTTSALIADPNRRMFIATKENIETLIDEIDNLVATGRTNFYDAFNTAFAVLQDTINQELHVPCNSAILFLTDGEMTEPENVDESDIIQLVTWRLADTEAMTGHPVVLFTYSVSEDEDVHAFPKQLACSTDNGVWSKIIDDHEIAESLTSYYKLFALGLGQNSNEDFVAWVELYSFATGGIMGTTVSAPVYDRSKDPHLFSGVVAMDFTLTALEKALGSEAGSEEALNRVVVASTAKCPSLNLTLCELESFRRQGSAGDEALCTATCTESDFVEIEAEKCPFVSDYPQDLWENIDNQGTNYEGDECLANLSSNNTAIIIGAVVGGIFALFILGTGIVLFRRRTGVTEKRPSTTSPAVVIPGATYVLPPPTNPNVSAPPGHFQE